jgi:hypothetical protein
MLQEGLEAERGLGKGSADAPCQDRADDLRIMIPTLYQLSQRIHGVSWGDFVPRRTC